MLRISYSFVRGTQLLINIMQYNYLHFYVIRVIRECL